MVLKLTDLGHYERFIDINLNQLSNVTTGRIYSEVIQRERRGGPWWHYSGDSHITNEIKRRMFVAEHSGADIVLIEVGGTVGDIESLPFMESLRQMRELGREDTMFIHVTYLPYIGASGELNQTDPTQRT